MTSTSPFTWGDTAPAGDVTEPIDAQKAAGYKKGQPDPHDEYNWLLQQLGRLTRASGGFESLQDAVEGLDAGDTGIVSETDLDGVPGQVDQERTMGWVPASIDVTGKSIVLADGGTTAIAVERDTITTAITSYALLLAGNIRRIISDGIHTAIIYGINVQLFNHDTGASVWTYTCGGGFTPNDVAMDANLVYVVSSIPDAAGHYLLALDRTTGAKVWGYNHGSLLFTVATDGEQVYVAGASGTGLNTVRALGTIGAGAGVVGWSTLAATVPALTGYGVLVCDRRRVYVASGTTVYSLSRFDGSLLRSVNVSPVAGDTVRCLAIDQSWLYVSMNSSGGADARRCWAHDKETLDRVWVHLKITGATTHLPQFIASDGCRLFVASNPLGSGGANVLKVIRGNRAAVWERVDPSVVANLPYHQMMIPEE